MSHRFRVYCAHIADFYDHLAMKAMNERGEFDRLWDLAWTYHDLAEHGSTALAEWKAGREAKRELEALVAEYANAA